MSQPQQPTTTATTTAAAPSAKTQFVGQIKIQGQTIFTISPQMLMQQQNIPKERKTRWGQFKIRKQEVQQDVVFNPLEALVSGNSLMAITQYGQSELELKRAIFGDPSTMRKSKWHHDIEKTFTPPMINYVSPNMSISQVEYLIRLYRLDEITCKLNDFAPEDPDVRSPSPEPIYNKDGVRVNTRVTRKKQSILKEKVQLIEDCMKMNKQFVPPLDYRPLKKVKRIYLTESAVNDTNSNYLGRIIGNKGSTQKRIQQITGCSISLRGRGISSANKDPYESYEKPHVLITADTNEQIDLGVEEIQKILNGDGEEDAPIGDGIVGIVEGMFDRGYCENCNETGHRTWECPEAKHIKHIVKCTICGETSHPTSDCPQKAEYYKQQQQEQINKLYQSQYSKFKDSIEGDKQKQASFSFITDFNKKDLLKIEGPKETPSAPAPASLGGFAMPSTSAPLTLPNFDKPQSTLPNFAMPKFDSKKKDQKDKK